MPTTEWLNKYEAIKDKLTCKDDLEAHFTEKVIGNMAVDVLDIGTVHFPTGQIFACDPLVELEDTLPFLQTIPAGTYPVKICVVPSEQYGDRYACVKVEVSQEKPVRYELGMVGNEDLDEELGEDEYFGFGVDAGMGCVADIQTQAAFKAYWAKRLEEDPDIDPYNDLFCDLMEENAKAYPKYQGDCGDWLNWTVPGTDCNLPIFASGWGDGYYTAMALAELYFQWKDNSKLDYDHEEAIWDKVTGFTASKEALAFLLRQLTDIKNEVPDEDGIREIVDLWKNEDSGEIAPAWLEHLNQLIDRLDSEQEARQMYIKKYWGNFIGGSDDSLNLVAFLEDQKKEEIPLSEIFAKIGLDKQSWDFRQTVEYLEFTHSDGVEMDFHFAIDVVTDLAAILLECSVSGSVNLQDLDEYNTPVCRIRITATPEEHDAMNKSLADFAQNPLEYDISEMMGEDEITDMAYQVEMLRKELYEASGRNRNYHVKAEDVKHLLPDWEGADGCIATNRITVEGYKVGYCYREKPDGGWDSGWRFTAGDESEAYMDDPNNAGIYKLNTICNDDPDIIPLLNTSAPCAFERDENGVFQQIKDWKPDEDEEDPDMDILKQCQKWHEEDKHQKIVDALEAISAEERTPEMDMELARAYNNLADSSEPEGRKLLHQALELMQSHEEELGDTYSWNFRMGYAYYYLDQEGRALRHFEKALELHPGDDPKLNTRQDMEELIDSCKKGISMPQFSECFRERTEDWWETFAEMEAELRQMMDEDKDHTRGAEIVAQMEETLNLVFDEISFEMGFNGEKHLSRQ